MARTDTLGNFLTDVAEAIRTKEGTTETIVASEFDTRISNLSSGGSEDLTEELTTYSTELAEQNTTLDEIILALKNKSSSGEMAPYAPRYISFYKYSGTELDTELANLDTSNITSMSNMFRDALFLKYIDLSNFNTEKVTDMSYMFCNTNKSNSVENGLIGLEVLNTSNVTNMSHMFDGSRLLTKYDLSLWNTGNVTDVSYMFANGSSDCGMIDLHGLNFENITNIVSMFYNNEYTTEINLQDISWGENERDLSNMFYRMLSLTTLDVSSMSTLKPTRMYNMFYYCTNLPSITGINNLDISSCTTLSGTFNGCSSLTTLDLSNWDTSNVTDMQNLFAGCTSLTSLDISGFDLSSIASGSNKINYMFSNCSSLQNLILGEKFNAPNATYFYGMFSNCKKLKTLDLSGFYIKSGSNITQMFYYCEALEYLDVRNVDFANSTWSSTTFSKVPTTCEIIVANDTQKEWFATKFASYTNVKTVAELEA